jgi:hypothetical protein
LNFYKEQALLSVTEFFADWQLGLAGSWQSLTHSKRRKGKNKTFNQKSKGQTVKKGGEREYIPEIPVLHKLDFVRYGQAVARTSLQRWRRYQRAQKNAATAAAAGWHHRRPFLTAVAVVDAIVVVAIAVVAIAVGRIRRGGGERGLVGLGEGEADLLVE